MNENFSVDQLTIQWAKESGVSVWSATETTSTNDVAKAEAFSVGEPFKIYVAGSQTKGRGRGTNTWTDVSGDKCLLSSWSYSVETPPQHLTGPLLGLALFESVTSVWPQATWSLKAPNDLYLGPKKVAGLLAESVTVNNKSRLIVGLGINVHDFPSEITTATSVAHVFEFGDQITSSHWQKFLTQLHLTLQSVVKNCVQPQLDKGECTKLLEALNKHPLLSEPYSEVTSEGDLVSPGGVQRWHEL